MRINQLAPFSFPCGSSVLYVLELLGNSCFKDLSFWRGEKRGFLVILQALEIIMEWLYHFLRIRFSRGL